MRDPCCLSTKRGHPCNPEKEVERQDFLLQPELPLEISSLKSTKNQFLQWYHIVKDLLLKLKRKVWVWQIQKLCPNTLNLVNLKSAGKILSFTISLSRPLQCAQVWDSNFSQLPDMMINIKINHQVFVLCSCSRFQLLPTARHKDQDTTGEAYPCEPEEKGSEWPPASCWGSKDNSSG